MTTIPPEKSNRFLFDHFASSKNERSMGYLSIMFRIFKDLARLREEKRLSQTDLATLTGITQSNIARIESGRSNPTLLQLIKITHALGSRINLESMSKSELEAWKDVDMESYME